ncbi:MAG: hypothetical protein HC867_10235 [Bacteroidia bacterium]|nr:hypothetical protein [Bacteroidia bacterium]
MKFPGLLFISIILILFSCRKDSFITSADATLSISADTLKFDTVFTTTGSITQAFKIINTNNRNLRLSSIKLSGGAPSSYKINADGFAGPEINNIELDANDSTYIFVNVTIDPSANNLPFIVRDSIQISFNGNNRMVQLEAWGQNAHFFRNKIVSADETWINDLPYVILGPMKIDAGKKLTIQKGCKIYVHADAPIIVDGTLEVNGEKDSSDRVYFKGDRLDAPYSDFPAAWPGIFFRNTSIDNVLNYTVIRNAYQAIALQDPASNSNPKLTLNQCIIDNAYDAGIIAVNSSVSATNCLISNCGKNLLLVQGGNYQFNHCTSVSYSNSFILHKDPVLLLSNFISINNVPVTADLNAVFRNCIFWGENGIVDDEVVVAKSGNTVFNVNFDHSLWKVVNNPSNVTTSQLINNQPPLFDSINTSKRFYSFRLKDGSPAVNAGINSPPSIDLDGRPRPVGLPDLGCF